MEYKVLFILGVAFFASCNAANPQSRPNPGDSCDPDECVLEGYCLDYWWCEREASDHKGKGKNGTWLEDSCDNEAGVDNMYWNPDHNGGSCDFWENLSDSVKQQYNNDRNCIDPHCEWKRDPNNECSGTYWYFHPDKNNGQDLQLHCPSLPDGEQLIWSQARKSCHPCKQVFRGDGTACC